MSLFKKLALSVGLICIVLLLGGISWLHSSLPTLNGHISVTGLIAPIKVTRDVHGIPHVESESERDAYFGLGFVHAQDRLWQMELRRRAGAGRLSEIFGKRTINADRYLRGLGFYQAAKESLNHFDEEALTLIDSYTDGINAYLAQHTGALPIEFIIFNHEPEKWRPADSIVSAKMMSQQLGGNARDELLRQLLSQKLTPTQISNLWPPYPGDPERPSDVSEIVNISGDFIPDLLALLPASTAHKVGSNNWVTTGRHTATGKPLLANDPHLGLTAPSPWYLAHLVAPDLNIAGATLPGIPVIIVGRNKKLAWGVTNTGPDVQDLFVEKLLQDNNQKYLTKDGPKLFKARLETIRVKNSTNHDITIRETYHGPVISDFSARHANPLQEDQVMSLAWTALAHDDTTLQAGFYLGKASSWREMRDALKDFIAPQQNFVGANTSGDIFFIAPGRIPVRRNRDGWFPSPGWTGDGDWINFLPFDQLPFQLNPEEGTIITANQKIVAKGYPHFITHDWAMPYRYKRIKDLLKSIPIHTIADYKLIQTDIQSSMAQDFLPLLLATKESDKNRSLWQALSQWDGTMAANLKEPLIFHVWYRELTRLVYSDELGSDFNLLWSRRPNFIYRALTKDKKWCDNITTAHFETCEQQITAAGESALVWLEKVYGQNQKKWKWGSAHKARHRHQALSDVPILGRFFDIVHQHDGGPYTIMQASTTISKDKAPFEENHGAALRTIFDLSDLDNTHVMITTGQSGNIFSKHYRDLSRLWEKNKWIFLPMTEEAIETVARHVLALSPATKLPTEK